ncbi:hypothetical protein [Pseudoflavonifractor capillosus]|jgi:hypothetical protein|uniref:hypothetical protein n=1 Tax=Pseudoflavonifractor capillosus TaxID=106588 RepID=UPI0018DEEDC0|nr:hypothetical protein [Pseudoflavonifractor capillosus]
MKTAVPTGTAALQSFDCTKYSRFGFTAKGQDCANVWAILCQFNVLLKAGMTITHHLI